jgi:hypothetical protein
MTDFSEDQVAPDDQRLRQLTDLRAGNEEFAKRLRSEGVQIQSLTNLRLETLIDLILTPTDRLDFELVYQARVHDGLEKVQTQARQAKARATLLTPAERQTPKLQLFGPKG